LNLTYQRGSVGGLKPKWGTSSITTIQQLPRNTHALLVLLLLLPLLLPLLIHVAFQVGRLATCIGSPMCDIHELDMGVAWRAAASTLSGSSGQGAGAKPQGMKGIKTDAEEVRVLLLLLLVVVVVVVGNSSSVTVCKGCRCCRQNCQTRFLPPSLLHWFICICCCWWHQNVTDQGSSSSTMQCIAVYPKLVLFWRASFM
jgi:hypothetical protein